MKPNKLLVGLFGLLLCSAFFALVRPGSAIEPIDPSTKKTEKPDTQADAAKASFGELALIPTRDHADYDPNDSRFMMHEWGTFTSFSGSDGVKLEFRPLADNDLPQFVFDRPRQAGIIPLSRMFAKQSYVSWQRMETPVIYFYTPEEMDVQVKVSFPEGLLTEFYPPVKSFVPPISETEKNLAHMGSVDVRSLGDMTQVANKLRTQLKDSELDWGTITLIPPRSLKVPLNNEVAARGIHERMLKKLVPRTPQHFDYYHARETDAAYIHTDFPLPPIPVYSSNYKPLGAFFEKFLFYRGIGNFELPLELKALGADEFEITNGSTQPIRSLILLNIDQDGQRRFTVHNELAGNENLKLSLPKEMPKKHNLAAEMEAALVNAGLFRKEAKSMVATWRNSWFGEPGTRLFYLLPESKIDTLLPLRIEPAPEQSVRVMVGRLEIMTPSQEQKIEGLLKTQELQTSTPLDPASALGVELASLGRFAEPALTKIFKSSKDAEVRVNAERAINLLINGLQPPKEVKNESTPVTKVEIAPDEAKVEGKSDSK